MIVHLKPEWKSFADYLGAMNSKFRTKAKQVMKKSAALEIIDFTTKTLPDYVDQIHDLYNELVSKANFTFGKLNGQTLANMKATLDEHFLFKGYFLDGKLIGFSTATSFDHVLDGNYIGLDYEFNQRYCLYQRMLYDFVEFAIEKRLDRNQNRKNCRRD